MRTIIRAFLVLTFASPCLLAQSLIVESEVYPLEMWNLLESYPIDHYVTTEITNTTNEVLEVTITTISKSFPDAWDIIDESPAVEESFFMSGFNNHSLFTNVSHLAAGSATVGTGIETIRIVATDTAGTEVMNITHEIEYIVSLPAIPTPSFIITNFEYDSIPLDTVYIPLEIEDPFSKDFYSYLEISFLDFYWLERPIVFEPQEIILENIENLECVHEDPYLEDPSKSWCKGDTISLANNHLMHQQMSGNIGTGNDYKMEFLMNIYDPIDSLNSNQLVRFIAKESECVYGKYTNLVDLPNSYAYTCPGGSITITTRPQYGSVTWVDEQNQITYTGSSVTFDNVQDRIYLNVSTRDDEGCLLFQNVTIEIEERYEDIVDIGEQEFEVCRGSDLTLNLLPGYDEAIWYNEMDGSTTTADSYTLTDIQDYVQLIVRVENADGCFSFQEVYIYVNDDGIYAEIVQDSSWQLCYGGDLLIELGQEYSQVVWSIISAGQVYNGNTLELLNVTDYVEIELVAVKNDGCTYRQYFGVYPNNDNNFNPDILLTELDEGLCLKFTLEAADGYETYEWYGYVNGNLELLSENQNLDLDYSSDPYNLSSNLQLFVSGGDGCGDFYEFGIYLKEPEESTLIDALALGEYCEGDDIELTVIETFESYLWSYQGQTFTGPSFSFVAGTQPVELVVTDVEGCAYRELFYTSVGNLPPPSLCLITNDEGTGNNVVLWEDPAEFAGISKYFIYREGDVTDEYIQIGEQDFSEDNIFVDKDSDPAQQAYKYHVRASNRCGDLSEPSNVHKTIHLTINQGTNDNVNLIWDSYEGISYDQVKIYRGNSPSNLEEYVGLPGTAFSFTDQNPPTGNVYYQIEVATEIECEIGKALYKIKSNVAAFETIGDSTDELGLTGKIFPNPFSNFLHLHLEEAIDLQVIASNGYTVYTEKLQSGVHSLSTAHLLPGAYLIRAISGDKVFAHTFIKTSY